MSEFKELTLDELVSLTDKRIGSITLSETVEAMIALEDDNVSQAEILESIRQRDYEGLGRHLVRWLNVYHQADIKNNGGL